MMIMMTICTLFCIFNGCRNNKIVDNSEDVMLNQFMMATIIMCCLSTDRRNHSKRMSSVNCVKYDVDILAV